MEEKKRKEEPYDEETDFMVWHARYIASKYELSLNSRHGPDSALNYNPSVRNYARRVGSVPDVFEGEEANSRMGVFLLSQSIQMNGCFPVLNVYSQEMLKTNVRAVDPLFFEVVDQSFDVVPELPLGITPFKFAGHVDIPASPKLRVPSVHPMVVQSVYEVDSDYPYFNYSFASTYARNDDLGVNVSFVTGQSVDNVRVAFKKLTEYKGLTGINSNTVYLATLQLIYQMRIDLMPRVDMDLSKENIISHFSKDTSLGCISMQFFSTKNGNTTRIRPPRKRAAAEAAYEAYVRWLDALQSYIDGFRETIPHVGYDLESYKLEIIRYVALLGDGDKGKSEDYSKKQRLFYIPGAICMALDKSITGPWINIMRFFMSGIGIKVTTGGILEMFEIMSCSRSSPLNPMQQPIIEKWLEEGVDLLEMTFEEGDWSNFDQTLSSSILGFAFATVFTLYSREYLEDPVTRLMFSIFHSNQVSKVMYVYLMAMFLYVIGRMFSGRTGTSTGDTVYNQIMVYLYRIHLNMKYPGNELISDIFLYSFFQVNIYGDDHLVGSPIVLANFLLYEDSGSTLQDFVRFCVEKVGMKYKYSAFATHRNLYGVRKFYEIDGDWVEDLNEYVSSPSFLKYRVAKIYFDDVEFSHCIPLKDPLEIVTKLAYSIKSSVSMEAELAKVIAIAHLATHPEAYSMCRRYYDVLIRNGAYISEESLQKLIDQNLLDDGILYQMSQDSLSTNFPSLSDLYIKQIEGFNNKTGFCPLDVFGNVVPAPDKYRVFYPRGFGEIMTNSELVN